jgi:hypothetical protein
MKPANKRRAPCVDDSARAGAIEGGEIEPERRRLKATAAVLLMRPTRIGQQRCVARPRKFFYDGATISSRKVSILRRGLLTFPAGRQATSACFSFGD